MEYSHENIVVYSYCNWIFDYEGNLKDILSSASPIYKEKDEKTVRELLSEYNDEANELLYELCED